MQRIGVSSQCVQPLHLPAICMRFWCFVNGVYIHGQVALLTSATAVVASLASHHTATQCLSINEVIKLSAWRRKSR